MKRLGFLLAVLVLVAAGAALTTAVAGTHAASKAICHRTSSATKPYVKISVPTKVLAVHLKHPADIYPVPKSGCPKTLLATTGGTAFDVTLVGNSESPAGDPVGNGTATVRLRLGQAQACYKIAAKNLPAAVAAHIHSGAAGSSGPVVIPLITPKADGTSSGCAATTRSLVAAILKNAAGYYVNVHTAEFPGGAIRGQLTGTSAADVGTVYSITLNGSTEPNATGTAVVRIIKDTNLVCYRLHAANVTLPTVAAHIHRGGASVNGPVVVPFTAPGANGDSSGCATSTPDLINEITGSPSGFYVNVHTREHPGGAMRNQLG
jgi:hypothetical protein